MPGGEELYLIFTDVVTECDMYLMIEGNLEGKLPTIWTDEKQRWERSETREE